jgi:uncharacterized circularly permuted ATP-grasp superfamily protein
VFRLRGYAPQGYDEVFEATAQPRPHYQALWRVLSAIDADELAARQQRAELAFREQGITFGAPGQDDEPIFPFDLVPRILPADEWRHISAGVEQRVRALNLFLADVYGAQACLEAGVVPAELVLGARHFQREAHGLAVPDGIYTHVSGIDLIRDQDGVWRVLEDNLRSPSGISYVLSNRIAMTRMFPRIFPLLPVWAVDQYPNDLLEVLRGIAPHEGYDGPTVAVLTPGVYNAAYYEHSFLAKQMGVELVESRDLVVENATLYLRTTRGLRRVDVLYRRIDDDFLDPLTFRPDSVLGAPGLFQACRAGNLALANAVGCGVADDKALYAYVPAIIRHFLHEEPILKQVETYVLADPEARRRVLEDIGRFVIKSTGESGGYGMVIGPQASTGDLAAVRERILQDPRGFIAQPLVELSTHPCVVGRGLVPRRVDLRVFVLYGREVRAVPGGLTRVALREGSYVVNSSQGGGSKDTWVLDD